MRFHNSGKTARGIGKPILLLTGVAFIALVSLPALALKYAAKEHDIDADPSIPTWIPGPLDIAPRQSFHIIGSDTMDEITLEWVRLFRKAYPKLSVTMEARASGTGASGLISGLSHAATVARELLPHEEKAFIEKFGYPATAFRVATGSVGSLGKTASSVILVDKDNPIEGLTMAQLGAIYSSTRKRGHREVHVRGDLGLTGEWASRPIHLYGLEPPNGIESFFQMRVLQDGEYKKNIEFVKGEGYIHAFTVGALGMASRPGGLTYAMMVNATPNVRVVPSAAEEGAPFVAPTPESVYKHEYPLSRYIHIFVNKSPDEELAPEIKEFLRVVMSYQGQSAVAREGVFIPLLPEVVDEELEKLKRN